VGISFFKEMTGQEISFFELTYYLFPLGWLMVVLIWGMMMLLCKPEKAVIPGLKERAKKMYAELGCWSKNEIMTLVIVLSVIIVIAAKNWVPALKTIDKTAILLTSTLIFFVLDILKLEDLENIPWNIILLFGGAMSIGFCLWQTHAAEWLAVNWLALFKEAPSVVFILGIAFFVMVMTNFIMNVAAIAISLPVALVIAPYLGVAGQVIFYSSLATAGMPFFLLIGAAPNAIAYGSQQFSAGEFFRYGMIASVVLMFAVWLMVTIIWPIMGMPILLVK
jgi:sodium-dependent dicarboxylate transporter 2/3/5